MAFIRRSSSSVLTLFFVPLLGVLAINCGDDLTETKPPEDDTPITGAGGSQSVTSTSVIATTTGTMTTTVGTTGVGGSGVGGSGGGATCADVVVSEPNETETAAFRLKTDPVKDCDGDGGTIVATIKGANDVDWYYYEGDDTSGCQVDPTRSLSQSESGIRLCKYVECLTGDTEVDCPSGTTAEMSPDARSGCCGTAGFDLDVNCTGTIDERTYVYIRLDQPNATAATCNAYTVDYHY